jgi:hypothetical protein
LHTLYIEAHVELNNAPILTIFEFRIEDFFITIAYLNGLDIPTIMAITGHKSYNMLKRYLKENADKIKRDLEKAWNF